MTAFSRNLRVFAWLNAVIQAAFPLAVAFTPAIAAASEKGRFLQQADTTPLRTRVYTLAAGETVATVAEKYNMSPAALHRLNQFRTFTRSFENLQPGDELDVPLSPLPAVQWQGQDSPPADTSQAQKMAGVATQAGHFFADNPGRDAAASLARGVASGAAEKEIQQWLGQAGTARVQLNTDRNLSLKNAQLDLLVPLSEQKDSLVFTQSSLHRTDDRGQANLGLGYRWFAGDWMVGGNTFLDYDLSRDHARLGLGLEYGRDFLKLSANSYHRLTNWKDAPELEDYQARPASGWDIRAQGWLPALPQFGATLTWEQYYGNEVALSGTNNRQRNPYALTGGVNYTPFPLLTFSAEQMQGKSGSNDTRLGAGVNYQPGVPWRQQINPEAVAGLRSLAGSRYDLVERNNNIVLEYRKKTVIHLRSAGQVTGFAGEQKSLGVSVTTRHGLERIDWSAAPLLAAGGKIVENGTDWAVELPAWNTAPDGVNSYTLTAVAVDTRGNVSNQSTTRVTLQAPEVSTINSEFTPAASTLPADGSSVSVLTLSIRDGQGKAMDVAPGEVEVTASGVKSASVSSPSRQGPGVFEVTVTAGEDAETVHLTPVVRGESLAPATVVINDVSPVPDRSSLEVDRSHYVAGEEMMLTVTLKDAQNHPVTGQAAALTEEAVTAPGATLKAGSNWTDNGDGSYTATYTAMTTSSGKPGHADPGRLEYGFAVR
ncbi:inverse autotransporter beta domain-containing protein [unidentified bacterial endosymbiont]|uniref:inverse autotransporter beta domain-containing protein n=1 Tax=unidentified bacterial endosymbiont TaxID=2355 RepID=UPI00209E25ED|nr:inverse autotransporter beta domain-containing protein [unidentified bacterial endosymbiont]